MASVSISAMLDTMAQPTGPALSRIRRPKRASRLKKKISGSMKDMIHTLRHHRKKKSGTRKKLEGKALNKTKRPFREPQVPVIDESEQIKLRRNFVFRTQVPIPTHTMMYLHASYKSTEIHVNRLKRSYDKRCDTMKAFFKQTDMSDNYWTSHQKVLEFDKRAIWTRCVLREHFEAQLRTEAEGLRIVIPEIRQFLLFENFFRRRGVPNEAETVVLQRVARHTEGYVNEWFTAREGKSKATSALQRE
ncbi:MAG: hypothetical protein Q9183_003123, partial [Haloplaca sp. 2 TL-2023]